MLDAGVAVPTRKPPLPGFLSTDRMPWLISRDGKTALQGELLGDALALLKITPLEGAPWLEALRTQFTEDSLQRLAETLMRAWLLVCGPPKEEWALHAVAHFPSDPVIAFLGKSAGELASSRAELAFTAAAARSGMSDLELAERLVPDFGLSPEGVLPITPPVRLVIEGVKARLVDATGKVLKAMPPIADDEVAGELAELKKRGSVPAREVADRFEPRMIYGARMTFEHFTEVYAQHGFARQVASRVLFGVYSGDALQTFFSVARSPVVSIDQGVFRLDSRAREAGLGARSRRACRVLTGRPRASSLAWRSCSSSNPACSSATP